MRGGTQTNTLDPLAGQPTDEHGIPLSIVHSPQTDLPVWQFIHKLATPVPNPRSADRPYTHICILCSAVPPLRPSGKKVLTWRNALMRQRMSTNAVAHMQRVHPDQFLTIAKYKRNALVIKAEAAATRGDKDYPIKKMKRLAAASKTKEGSSSRLDTNKTHEMNVKIVPGTEQRCPSKLEIIGSNDNQLVSKWLISSGFPLSIQSNVTFQQLLNHSLPHSIPLPTAQDLSTYIDEEFATFCTFLRSYLVAESKAAMGQAFLSLRYEFRPIIEEENNDKEATMDVSSTPKKKAFFSLKVGFIDSQWRRVELVLVAKVVPLNFDQSETQLVNHMAFETYHLPSILTYARFQSVLNDPFPLKGTLWEDNTPAGEPQEDGLTSTVRWCVGTALGVRPGCSFHSETSFRRILHLLEKLVHYFDVPDRATALAAFHATDATSTAGCVLENVPLSTLTSIGAILNLVKTVCVQFPSYWCYFQSPTRPTATMPELETAWTHLSIQDWQTVAEVEGILNHLSQFHLHEQHLVRPAGTVTSSYTLLFRRLLSVTMNSSSFKCYALDEATIPSVAGKVVSVRRQAKPVESFTSFGRHVVVTLRHLIFQQFPTPSSPLAIEDEIKAMLLDPRISSKAADLVTDTRAFLRAKEALRQEHRLAFEVLAVRPGFVVASPLVDAKLEDENEEEDEDEELRALLMVDGPPKTHQATASSSSSITTGKQSYQAVAQDEASAWRDWQQVYVAWDTHASNGVELFDKGQYNLLKLYHHVNILAWFRDVGQVKYPAASLLARIYLGQQQQQQQYHEQRALGVSLLRFTAQEQADWMVSAAERAEKRCLLYHNWQQYQQLSLKTRRKLSTSDEHGNSTALGAVNSTS